MEFIPKRFSQYIGQQLGNRPGPVDILEIGGGAVNRVSCRNARFTMLDLSEAALARIDRKVEKVVGDAQNFDLGARRFDVAVFWNVLEHVPQPDAALERACAHVRNGGILVVRGPELTSLKALVTRYTPYWFHVLYYRWVLGIADAGRDGRPPCRVEHQAQAGRAALRHTLERLGMKVTWQYRYVGDQVTELKRFSRVAYTAYAVVAAAIRRVSNERYGSRTTEFILVARKPGLAPA